MSDKSNKKNEKNEEIDLLLLLNLFENKVKNVFTLIFNVLKFIFDIFIYLFKLLKRHFVKLIIILGVAFALGITYDLNKPELYSSKMVVKPFFESKYQLVTDIQYYNELIATEQIDKLASIFEIDTVTAKSLSNFEIENQSLSGKDQTILYNSFVKSLDTLAAVTMSYNDFIETITIYDAIVYEITVTSSTNNAFDKISKGFKKIFISNNYSNENKKKSNELIKIKKEATEQSLGDINLLQDVYISELNKDKNQTIDLFGSSSLKLSDQQTKSREYDLLKLQITEQNKLTNLEEERILKNQVFEIISDFQSVGLIKEDFFSKMRFIFPLASLFLFFGCILFIKFNRFVDTYKLNF